MFSLTDLCFLCLTNSKELKNILAQDIDGVVVEEKLRYFLFELVNIKPEIPKHICFHCLKDLNHVYEFKQRCLRNIIKLNNYVHSLINSQGQTQAPFKLLQVDNLNLTKSKEPQDKPETSGQTHKEVIVKRETDNEADKEFECVLLSDGQKSSIKNEDNLSYEESDSDEQTVQQEIENIVIKIEPEYIPDDDEDDNDGQRDNGTEEDEAMNVVDANMFLNPNTQPQTTVQSSNCTMYRNSNLQKINNEHPKKRRRKTNKQWNFDRKFESTEEAEEYIKSEKNWGYHYKNRTEEGLKKVYRCNKVKSRGEQCNAGVLLLNNYKTNEIVLFRTLLQHNCHFLETKSKFSNEASINKIKDLYSLHFKPRAILDYLRQNNFEVPTKIQLNNFLQKLRKENCGESFEQNYCYGPMGLYLQPGYSNSQSATESTSNTL